MSDCIHFLLENRLNGCQIFGRFGFQKPNPNRISVFRTFLLARGIQKRAILVSLRVVESPMTIPEVTSETRRRGRGGRRSGRRQGRQRKNEVPGSATADSDAGKKTNLRQAIEQQQHHLAVAAETTTTSLDDRQPPRLPLPTGNQPSAATPVDDNDNESAEDDWEASGNEGSDDKIN